jgi:hypothetical protein
MSQEPTNYFTGAPRHDGDDAITPAPEWYERVALALLIGTPAVVFLALAAVGVASLLR